MVDHVHVVPRATLQDLVCQLLAVPEYGWSKDGPLLAQALGFRHEGEMRDQLGGLEPLRPQRQKAASEAMAEIIAGSLAVERRMFQGKLVSSLVQVDKPKPLIVSHQLCGFVSIGRRGVRLSFAPRVLAGVVRRPMPTFEQIWNGTGRSA